jgi:TRAP-type mannitol/chloroaromatic compound transport system permease large subunit
MEIFFLALLFILMIWALSSGFPVAFALPGSAIIAVGLAALTGYLFAGDPSAYFAQDGPSQWLSAGVTNFRSLYWIVERDTLIAIPLFIFMGIMLQRSKIAEDLLVAMAQLFGPLPGGLGISVVFVGALLAATTGIVGATVIAMGLISLPAMLRNNYSKSLATGTICASGTLGQIIPPSIVLIILADQLSNAADQANTMRKTLYKEATGDFSMPSQFDVVSASAGDMFMGALVPGIILVGLYMLYILVYAWIKPEVAPPVPYEGKYDRYFILNVLLALVPPLTLIFIVLGSIILGVATVNQAGAIGAIGAMIMAGYRLHTGHRKMAYIPAYLALFALIAIGILSKNYDLNIRSITSEEQFFGIKLAIGTVALLLIAVFWSTWRVFKIDDTLKNVMIDTAKMTSMVFIILIGAAMLTSAFRGFGGEELVKHFLTTLPGGFWTQFVVVMLVIFLLGFFLDFIEIAVVVVPIVAPILLSNPEANVTAVWLGVMIGLNIQTSFLTPPFGFALFYLRGVADKIIKTTDIYKGASAFISLQLLGLLIVGLYPSLVNYLPNRTHLLSETAPPPMNPKLQLCLEDYVLDKYANEGDAIKDNIAKAQKLDTSYLPDKLQANFKESLNQAYQGLELIENVKTLKLELDKFTESYQPVQQQVSYLKTDLKRLETHLKANKSALDSIAPDNLLQLNKTKAAIAVIETQKKSLEASIPKNWESNHKQYKELNEKLSKARRQYYNAADSSYENLRNLRLIISDVDALTKLGEETDGLESIVTDSDAKTIMQKIETLEKSLSKVNGSSAIKSKLSKARRTIKKAKDKDEVALNEARNTAKALILESHQIFKQDVKWRTKAKKELLPGLQLYDASISNNLGLRQQSRFSDNQAKQMARCLSHHKNISLAF